MILFQNLTLQQFSWIQFEIAVFLTNCFSHLSLYFLNGLIWLSTRFFTRTHKHTHTPTHTHTNTHRHKHTHTQIHSNTQAQTLATLDVFSRVSPSLICQVVMYEEKSIYLLTTSKHKQTVVGVGVCVCVRACVCAFV